MASSCADNNRMHCTRATLHRETIKIDSREIARPTAAQRSPSRPFCAPYVYNPPIAIAHQCHTIPTTYHHARPKSISTPTLGRPSSPYSHESSRVGFREAHDSCRAAEETSACLGEDRERVKLENQEKKLVADIKKSAKNGQMGPLRIQAKDLVRTRRYAGQTC
jgi:hypothetical protein